MVGVVGVVGVVAATVAATVVAVAAAAMVAAAAAVAAVEVAQAVVQARRLPRSCLQAACKPRTTARKPYSSLRLVYLVAAVIPDGDLRAGGCLQTCLGRSATTPDCADGFPVLCAPPVARL